MQKTIIAAAIIGLVSAGASAVTLYEKDGTKVDLAGKFDFAVQKSVASDYKSTDASYAMDPKTGLPKLTAAVPATNNLLDSYGTADGKYSRSRLNFKASTAINSDLTASLNYDFRFADVFVGKNAATSGGIQDNDAMEATIESKKFGLIRAGTTNTAVTTFAFKKPYVNVKESEIVKYGVSNMGLEGLTNRNILLATTKELPVVAKFSYGFSKESAARTAAQPDKAPLWSAAVEGSFGGNNLFTFGFGTAVKESSNNTDATKSNRIQHNEGFVSVEKSGFKGSFIFSTDKADNADNTFVKNGRLQGMGMGVNLYYLVGDKLDLGVSLQKYTDQSDLATRLNNDGRGYMAGAHYYATKEITLFAGVSYQGWDRNEAFAGAKIAGPLDSTTDAFKKEFGRAYYAGVNYTF